MLISIKQNESCLGVAIHNQFVNARETYSTCFSTVVKRVNAGKLTSYCGAFAYHIVYIVEMMKKLFQLP